jgi:hypothetical protein
MSLRAKSAVLASAVLLSGFAGCGGADTDTLPKAMLQLLDDTTAVLKEIKDVETAKAAEPKLKDLAARKAKLDEQAKATKMSKSELDESDEKYAQPIQEAAGRMTAEVMRIANASPEAAQIVATAMGMDGGRK